MSYILKLSLNKLAKYSPHLVSYSLNIVPNMNFSAWDKWGIWHWSGSGVTPDVKDSCTQSWIAKGQLSSLQVP
jgi:hypothetical protein